MAIAFTGHFGGGETNGTSVTRSATPTGSNSIVVASVRSASTTVDPTSVTWNGNAMSLLSGGTLAPTGVFNGGKQWLYIYYNGTADGNPHDVVATWAVTHNSNRVDCLTFDGAAQSGAPDSVATFNNGAVAVASPYTTSTTVVAANSMLALFLAWDFNGNNYRGGTNSTGFAETGNDAYTAYSTATVGTGSQSLVTLYDTTPDNNAGILISLAPFVAVGPANLKTVNGLAKASVKTIDGLAIASVKSWNGLA